MSSCTDRLLRALLGLIPRALLGPQMTILAPNVCGSTCFRRSFLTRRVKTRLIRKHSLIISSNCLGVHAAGNLRQISIICHHVSSSFVSPLTFQPSSLLKIPKLVRICQTKQITVTGTLNAKMTSSGLICTCIPRVVHCCLSRRRVVPGIPAFLYRSPARRTRILDGLSRLIIGTAGTSNNCKVLINPRTARRRHLRFTSHVHTGPENCVTRPALYLSHIPALVSNDFRNYRISLQPCVLCKRSVCIGPNNLAHITLGQNSLIIGSSRNNNDGSA